MVTNSPPPSGGDEPSLSRILRLGEGSFYDEFTGDYPQVQVTNNDSLVNDIANFNQLADFRVGVKRGTTYESMVQKLLVDTGLTGTDK